MQVFHGGDNRKLRIQIDTLLTKQCLQTHRLPTHINKHKNHLTLSPPHTIMSEHKPIARATAGHTTGEIKMSKKVTMTMYAHKADQWDSAPFILFPFDMSECGRVCLGEVEVTFTPPTTDPVEAELASIDKAEQAVRTEMQGKLNALENRRANLLAIGSDGGKGDEH